jgi:hypothetical protein
MTAVVTHVDRSRIRNAGFHACLAKSFGPEELVETDLNSARGLKLRNLPLLKNEVSRGDFARSGCAQ